PWVAMKFTGAAGGISIEAATLDRVRDLLSAGSPLALELAVLVDGAPAGGAAVNAVGVNADGSIVIKDLNPAFGRASLKEYLNGFAAQGHSIQASLTGVIQIVPALSTPAGFVAAAPLSAHAAADSPAGACGNAIDIFDPAIAGQAAPPKPGGGRFIACDGTQSAYQLGFGTNLGASVLDL